MSVAALVVFRVVPELLDMVVNRLFLESEGVIAMISDEPLQCEVYVLLIVLRPGDWTDRNIELLVHLALVENLERL